MHSVIIMIIEQIKKTHKGILIGLPARYYFVIFITENTSKTSVERYTFLQIHHDYNDPLNM